MQTISLTPFNVYQYVGHNILFIHGGNHIVRRLERVSNGRKTIIIDYPVLQNSVPIVSKKVRVIL